MRETVYLFDIDGTLIDGGGSGGRAMISAFADVVGDGEPLRRLRFDGMTDPAIVRAGLRTAGRAPEADEETIARVIELYLERLPESIAQTPNFRLHAGVRAALDVVTSRPRAAVGLGTGNVERGARLKLAPVGIDDVFAFGGFGSDHEDRPTLVGIGAARGSAALQVPRGRCRVVVVGDTPKDVAAAAAIGAECLAVATSFYGVDALRAAGARCVVADLGAPEALAFLRGA